MSEIVGNEAARRMGESIAADVLERGPKRITPGTILGRIANDALAMSERQFPVVAVSDPRLDAAYALLIRRFLNLLADPAWADEFLPVITTQSNEFGAPVPIDMRNPLCVAALVSLNDQTGDDPLDIKPGATATTWRRAAERAPFLGLEPRDQVASTFFGLLASSFSNARLNLWSGGSSKISFTVNCATAGYKLEHWPQCYFSPLGFGSALTYPVTHKIPVNDYHFQGWINQQVTQDGGLHRCDAHNTSTILSAF